MKMTECKNDNKSTTLGRLEPRKAKKRLMMLKVIITTLSPVAVIKISYNSVAGLKPAIEMITRRRGQENAKLFGTIPLIVIL